MPRSSETEHLEPNAVAERLSEALFPLTGNPRRGAVLCDIDGTLAPIVPRPEDAHVPGHVSELLDELSRSYACVACVSGRAALDARRVVGQPSIAYVGLHGAEWLAPGRSRPRVIAALESWRGQVDRFAAAARDAQGLLAAGVRIEDKGPIVAFHVRGAADENAAMAYLRRLAGDAEKAGLSAHWGRKVLEVRPPVAFDKGQAVCHLVAASDSKAALYGGDDTTDLDAFEALEELMIDGRLSAALTVGVRSEEGPPAIVERARLVVDGVAGFAAVLERLVV